jgi:heavy metal sensor kinase
MRSRSIRFRLTAWYTAVLALALVFFGVFSWFAVREVLLHAVDEELSDRVNGVRRFMDEQIGALSVEEIRDEFKEHSVLGPGGDFFQVCDARGVWLYRSASLEDAEVPIQRPSELTPGGSRESRLVKGVSVRFLSRPVTVLGNAYTIQVAALTGEIEEGLERFRWALIFLIPAVLAMAATGGWWLSRLALQPVDRITATARSIGERNLGKRLPVPETDDELQRLSETLNQMLDRIEDAFQRITRFTADASHELRTPVALIRTTSEIALRKKRDDTDYRDALGEIHSESIRTTELIENLLTLARTDAGWETLDRKAIDLSTLLLEATTQAQKLANEREIRLIYEPVPEPLSVVGDGSSLRRLLLILLDNALKYTHPGGTVTVLAKPASDFIRIEVQDSGIGIGAEHIPRIFERFYRADPSRSRDSGGAGLGLSLAKWIVEAHGGAILVESTPGAGSTFTVRLPKGES